MSANLAILKRSIDVWGAQRVAEFLYTGPASYPNTGGTIGDPIVTGDTSLGGIELFPSFIAFDPTGGAIRHCVYDFTRNTVRWFVGTTGVEVANGVDLSAYSARIVILD